MCAFTNQKQYCHPILLLSYTALPLSCYFAIVILLNAVMLLCHSCCLAIVIVPYQSCCQHFPWYSITVMLYSLLSGHFATLMLHCCLHAALPLYMLLTTVHVVYHCPATLPLSYSLASNTDCQFYALVSPSLCLPLFDYFATFRLLWWYHTAWPVSYGLTTVMPVCHACYSPTVTLPC